MGGNANQEPTNRLRRPPAATNTVNPSVGLSDVVRRMQQGLPTDQAANQLRGVAGLPTQPWYAMPSAINANPTARGLESMRQRLSQPGAKGAPQTLSWSSQGAPGPRSDTGPQGGKGAGNGKGAATSNFPAYRAQIDQTANNMRDRIGGKGAPDTPTLSPNQQNFLTNGRTQRGYWDTARRMGASPAPGFYY